MINILLYAPNAPTSGVTNAVYTLHKKMNRSKIKINVVTWPENEKLITLAHDFGGNAYLFKVFFWRHPIIFKKRLREILASQNYDIVVFNLSCINTLYPFKLALKCMVKKVIIYSHSSKVETSSNAKRIFLTSVHYLLRKKLKQYSTLQLCCSNKAGEWMYGSACKSTVINNAIELDEFQFNINVRKKNRTEFSVENNVVIGHVGRLSYAKNQKYLIEIFEEIIKHLPSAKLWIIGEGPLRKELEKEIHNRRLTRQVQMWGNRNDISTLLNCMDCFVLPSLFEGAPVAAIEAQANGLPCVISSNVDTNCIITSNTIIQNINAPKQVWANTIIDQCKKGHQETSIKELRTKGWDLENATIKLEQIYLS